LKWIVYPHKIPLYAAEELTIFAQPYPNGRPRTGGKRKAWRER